MKKTVLLLLLSISQITTAGIYKCVDNGKVSFSQRPCSDTAQAMQLKTPKKLINDASESAADRNSKVEDYRKTLESSRLTRQYKREISANEKSIRKNKKTLKVELAKIQATRRHRRSVHTVEEYKLLKQTKMALLKLKINKKIQTLQNEIKSKKKAILKLKQSKDE